MTSINAIMVELFGATMDQMRFDDEHKVGTEIAWDRFAQALAEERRRRGASAPRQETVALRGREPHGNSTDGPEDTIIILPTVPEPVPGGDWTFDEFWGYAHQPTVDWARASGGRLA